MEGPAQRSQGQSWQYLFWICLPHPLPETVAQHGVKCPEDFGRSSLAGLVIEAYTACGVELLETVCFSEPHASGKPHLNILVLAKRPYRWLRICRWLLQHHRAHVGFGANIRSWSGGAAYGRVATEHKGPESFDHNSHQRHHAGKPVPLDQLLPLGRRCVKTMASNVRYEMHTPSCKEFQRLRANRPQSVGNHNILWARRCAVDVVYLKLRHLFYLKRSNVYGTSTAL